MINLLIIPESSCLLGVWTTIWVGEYQSRRDGQKMGGYNDDNFNDIDDTGDGSNHMRMVIYHYIFIFIHVELLQFDI